LGEFFWQSVFFQLGIKIYVFLRVKYRRNSAGLSTTPDCTLIDSPRCVDRCFKLNEPLYITLGNLKTSDIIAQLQMTRDFNTKNTKPTPHGLVVGLHPCRFGLHQRVVLVKGQNDVLFRALHEHDGQTALVHGNPQQLVVLLADAALAGGDL
jgi:hypothetical protein